MESAGDVGVGIERMPGGRGGADRLADPKLGGKMDFAGFNAGYKEFFGTAENPNLVARSTVQVAGLAGPNFLIEIEAIAAKVP